jgi:cytidylate kinase
MTESPRTTVVAMSRQLGSGGAAIAQRVARYLHFRYADSDILHEAALRLRVDDSAVAPLEERAESFWEHLTPLFLLGVTAAPWAPPLAPTITGSGLFGGESEVIRQLAARENAVIVGHGAAHVLRGHPTLISAFAHAHEDVRVARLTQRLPEPERAHVIDIIRRSDRQRAEFNKSLTGRDWTDATQYTLCVDTSTIGLEDAADIVSAAVVRSRHSPLSVTV